MTHQNLQLKNVFKDYNGYLMLCNYGLTINNEARNEHIKGIHAPELAKKGADYTPECDWWSLGIIVYMLLKNGDSPFSTFSSRVEISTEAEDFISELLTIKPKERLGSKAGAKEVLAHEWLAGTFDTEEILAKTGTVPPEY
jgi:serine/threonine protein kinase